MTDAQDMDLVQEFARQNSEAAFTELVRRHIALVYSVARRCTDNADDAKDVTQAVFIILARKAAGLHERTLLPGWLYETTRFTAARLLRTNARRQKREQEAYMQSTLNEANTADVWERLSPHLEDAMSKLAERDRALLVLRFYQNKSGPEAAALMGIREGAAHMRVTRAIEKLRKFFAQRGVTLSGEAVAGAISANSVQAVPEALAKSVTAVAIAKGAAASTSTLTLIKGALKIMAWTKAKTVIVIGVLAVLTAGTTTVVVKNVIHRNVWADDSTYWSLNNPPLASYPPVLILRPTRFAGRGGLVGNGNRFVGRDLPIQELVAIAYDYFGQKSAQIIFPDDLPQFNPQSGYDLMLTLPNDPRKALQEAIAKRFGLVAHTETIMTNVLLEKVVNPYAPGLKRASSPAEQPSGNGGDRFYTLRNQPLNIFLSGDVESVVGQPVLNETGLRGRYDLTIQWQPEAGETDQSAFERAMREQLGLELVPTKIPIEMLVVEKAK
jgi:uncharacterized protein (TIGR03435 family)